MVRCRGDIRWVKGRNVCDRDGARQDFEVWHDPYHGGVARKGQIDEHARCVGWEVAMVVGRGRESNDGEAAEEWHVRSRSR